MIGMMALVAMLAPAPAAHAAAHSPAPSSAVAAPPATTPPRSTPGSTVADQRDAMRDVCAKLRGKGPTTKATRAAFARCIGQIRYDGDLPAAEKPQTR